MGTPAPVSGTALALATAAVLVAGGLWWVGTAPPPGSVAVPPAGIARPTPEHSAALTAATGPGMVQARPTPSPRVAYPDPAEIVRFDVDEVEDLLPDGRDVVRRQAGVLTAGGTIDYRGPVPAGQQFLLDITCVGEGGLHVSVVIPGASTHTRVYGCDSTVETIHLTASGTGMAAIQVLARTPTFVGVAIQLARL